MGRSLNRSTKPATALVPSKIGRSRNLPYQLLMRKRGAMMSIRLLA